MFCSRSKLLCVCLLSVFILARIEANRNSSDFYVTSNVSKTTLHQFAIINDNTTFVDATNLDNFSVIADAPSIAILESNTNFLNLQTKPESANTLSQIQELHLEKSSVIYGLTKAANLSQLSPICYAQLKHIQRSILKKEPWAMKVLDASGTKNSGFVFGMNFWLGSREACGAVQRPVAITLSKDFHRVMHFSIIKESSPFDMTYRMLYLRHHSPWQVEIKLMSEQIIHIGLCLPSACAIDEIERLTAAYIERGMFVENDIYDIRPQVVYMKDLKLKDTFYNRQSVKIIFILLIFTFGMIMSASILRGRPLLEIELKDKLEEDGGDSQRTTGSESKIGSPILSSKKGTFKIVKNFIQLFDIETNCVKLFSNKETTNAATEIPVINGLRSVCAIWLLAFHVVWFSYFTVNNKTFLIYYAEQIFFQYMSSAPLLVDVFFTISGFLQTYNYMRNKKQMDTIRRNSFVNNMRLFFKMLFHRYLRLAPLYLILMGVADVSYTYINDISVYHISDRFDEICAQNWWRNFLFIQNLYDHKDMCLNWTWSLACEMQFFVLATIFLFIYAKHPKFVKGVTVLSFVATVIWSFAIGLNSKFQLSFDAAFATGTQIYISPFVRVMPYILGAMAAWYLIENEWQFELTDLREKCLWNLAILVFFICIYSTIKRDMSYLMSIALFVVGRFCFSLSICWMIIGSATGRSSWWSRILEAKIFQHFNRLSYAIYLLNPLVIAVVFSLTNASTHADPFMLSVLTLGFAVIVYIASIVFSLAFEIPYSNWSSLLLKQGKRKSE